MIILAPGILLCFVLRVHAQENVVTFTIAGDYGANGAVSGVLDKIAAAKPDLHLAIGDLSYGQLTPESAWCAYIRTHVGSALPFEILAGNHEDHDPYMDSGKRDYPGDIDKFAACMPNLIKTSSGGSAVTGKYAKEYYFDYPPAAPLARFINISAALTIDGSVWNYRTGNTHYNWLVSAIDSARAKGIPWIIVNNHIACFHMKNKWCEPGADL